jgi:hypothetical protein
MSRVFASQAIANPLRGIIRLEVARRRELRERVARAPVGFGRLLRAQLAAVQTTAGFAPRAAACDARRLDVGQSGRRQRPAAGQLRSDRDAVVNEVQHMIKSQLSSLKAHSRLKVWRRCLFRNLDHLKASRETLSLELCDWRLET